jgi:hypothetical protein
MLEGKKIGNGTGFIYQPNGTDKKFLLTNYHIITASSPKEPESILNGYPDCPDEIKFNLIQKGKYMPMEGCFSLRKENNPKWLEHRDRAKGVDIVALPLNFPKDAIVVTQNQLGLVDDILVEVGSDLFVVGFPYGYGAGDYFPIWKRGTVASEPAFKPEGLSRFYIDSFTKPGMSGSPVFAIEKRDIIPLKQEEAELYKKYETGDLSALELMRKLDFDLAKNVKKKKFLRLVGIYSGRVTVHSGKDPNIGIVWKKQLIDEIFSDPQLTEHPFPPE